MRSSLIGSPLLNSIQKGTSRLSPGGCLFTTTHPAHPVLNEISPLASRAALKHPSVSGVTVEEYFYPATQAVFLVRTIFSITDLQGRSRTVTQYSQCLGSQLLPLRGYPTKVKKSGGRLYRVLTSPAILQLGQKRRPEHSYGG